MSREGYSPIHRASGSSSTWRGLSLGMSATQTLGAGDGAAVAFDVLYAETDGIRSTGTNGPYSGTPDTTVPTGACGVVPTGMAGLWRLSANCDVYPSNGGQFFAFGIIINNFAKFWEDDLAAGGDWAPPSDFNLTVASLVYPLEEGDVVWCNFFNTIDGATDVGGQDATFLMEYLGPAPEAS